MTRNYFLVVEIFTYHLLQDHCSALQMRWNTKIEVIYVGIKYNFDIVGYYSKDFNYNNIEPTTIVVVCLIQSILVHGAMSKGFVYKIDIYALNRESLSP